MQNSVGDEILSSSTGGDDPRASYCMVKRSADSTEMACMMIWRLHALHDWLRHDFNNLIRLGSV